MVGDDQRIRTVRHRLARLRGRQNAFHDQWQLGVRAQPAQVVPALGLLHQRRAKQHRALQCTGVRGVGHVAQVGRLYAVGQRKARAFDGRVHRPDDRGVARGFGTANELQAVRTVRLQIQLEPAGCALPHLSRCRLASLGNVFQGVAGQGAHQHASLQGGGCTHGGQLTLGVHQALVGHGGEQDGAGQVVAQQRGAGVGAPQVGNRLGQQPQSIPGLAIVGECEVLVCSALNVPPGMRLDVMDGMALIVCSAGNVCRYLAVRCAHRRSQGVELGGVHQASDHMRSRLW